MSCCVRRRRSGAGGLGGRLVGMVLAVVIIASGLASLQPAAPAQAAPDADQPYLSNLLAAETLAISRADFRAGNLISDGNFYNGSALSEFEVQKFLSTQVPACRAGYTCLKLFRQTTSNKAADAVCGAYAGADGESAARIITKVGLACGISQQVLLVLLQKEQGLVTDTWPLQNQYDRAVGYNCPGTTSCDPEYLGFFKQLFSAARQFKFYSSPANTTLTYFPVGAASKIKYSSHPERECASPAVTIQNKATAALYYYTPFQPNAAALTNFFGDGDECSEYGNRNFWGIYNGWFGSSMIDRRSGPDRFDASAAISRASFGRDVATVYVANGFNFPDALSGAPVAAKDGSPILLVTPGGIPTSIAAELGRLDPQRIVVLGGPASVSAAVETALRPFTTGTVERWDGADRFEASAAISRTSFGPNVPVVYVANGFNFPDALSGAPVAAKDGSPILLVTPGGIPTSIAAELGRLDPQRIVVLGGPASVSAAVETALRPFTTGTVERWDGADRFEASAAISRTSFGPNVPVVYLANGLTFPDALSGAPVAGKDRSPVLLVTADSIPTSIATELKRLQPAKIVVLGGTSSVSAELTGKLNAYLR